MAVCKITLGGLGWVLVYDNKTTKTRNRPFGGPASAHLRRLIEPHEKTRLELSSSGHLADLHSYTKSSPSLRNRAPEPHRRKRHGETLRSNHSK